MVEVAAEADSAQAADARGIADKILHGATLEEAIPGNTEGGLKEAAAEVDSKAATPAKEPPKEPAKEAATEPEDPESLAIIMRARKNARKIQEKAREEENARLAAIEQRAKALEAQQQQLMEQLTTDPVGALKSMGFTEEQIAKKLLGQDAGAPNPLERRLAELEAKLKEQAKADEARKAAQEAKEHEQVITSIKRGFIGHVVEKEANFPYLTSFYEDDPQELADRAFNIAETYRARTGKTATYQEVAAFLEDELVRKYTVVQTRTKPAVVEEKATSKAGKTLTPGDASQRASKPRKEVSDMDEDERRAEAARLAAETILGRGR